MLYLGIGVLVAAAAVGILWWVAQRRDWLARSSVCRCALHVYNALMNTGLQANGKQFISFSRTQPQSALLWPLTFKWLHVPSMCLT